MTKKNDMPKTEEEAINDVLDIMQDKDKLSDETLAELKQQRLLAAAMDGVCDLEQATLEAYSPVQPQEHEAWERMMLRHPELKGPDHTTHHQRTVWLWFAGIAASIAILWCFYYFTQPQSPQLQGDVVLTADDGDQRVQLTDDSGEEINLGSKEDLSKLGAHARGKDELTLTATASTALQVLTIKIPRGQMFKLILSDGTEVWLNNDTRLKYPSRFIGRTRQVWLEGEAYFKVKHNAARPFIVHAGDLQTIVHGTEFDVSAHEASQPHVALINGAVTVKSKNGQSSFLTPGKDASLTENGRIVVKDVDVEAYAYWKDGYFYFDGATLETIMKELGRWYNMNVVFKDEKAKNLEMHFICERKEHVDKAIKLLNMMGKAEIEYRDNTIYIR